MKSGRRLLLGLLCAVVIIISAFGCLAEEALSNNEFLGENIHGVGGVIRVKVTMDSDRIIDIKTIEQHETRGLGTTAILQLTKDIINANSTDVDIISGATLSSIAFKAAVRQAVDKALDTDPALTVELGANEYLGISDNALGGRLMVKVTIAEGKITAIDVLESYESDDIGNPALEVMKQSIMQANSTIVDSISGATYTCNALCEAVQQALSIAGM